MRVSELNGSGCGAVLGAEVGSERTAPILYRVPYAVYQPFNL